MRRSLVLLFCLAPATAVAAPYNDVWHDDGLPCPDMKAGVAPLTSSSRILYVNDCLPNGCTVTKNSANSALSNTSSIASGTVRMSPYIHGQAHWDEVIACVRETFAPFDITVVTEDPGATPHYEVMAAGTSAELSSSIMNAGGIAPFISCNAQHDSMLVFVFANQTSDKTYLCAAIAHEAGHAYGLSHSLDPRDPMTYMDLGSLKRWQNAAQTCGTETPENCRCFPSTQNSFRYLKDTFGLHPSLEDAALALDTPRDGMWVKPGFPIRAAFASPLDTLNASMSIDGGATMPSDVNILAWNAPASLTAGSHRVSVTATDYGDRTATATATVNIMQACGAGCADGFTCFGGFCVPGSSTPGGLGASCTESGQCTLGQCASDGETSLCTGTCEQGGTCPSGFACIEGANVCWPADDGGCSTTGGSPASLLFGAGALVLARRRRRATGARA
ncbi:MAG: MYXO-CTERM sorting domain-containing protein [Kofleriaceae bacterium]|nr:MYXO-CTERM sorting domain-containing protein [Kofleriaceae bacterium]